MAVSVLKIKRIEPKSVTITIENDINERQPVTGSLVPRINGRTTRIRFEAIVDKCDFKDHPFMGESIEVAVDESVHLVVLKDFDITYSASHAHYTEVRGSGIVVDTFRNDDHPLKRAVDKAVNSQKEKP